jgi:hypothetical protein
LKDFTKVIKVAGFSFIRNAIKYDYPIVEAIESILPICEVVYIAVGNSDDDTRRLVNGISPKVVIIDTIWDDTLREGGRVLAQETNKVFQSIPKDYDWCVYIQGDEVLHEQGHNEIRKAMKEHLNHSKVEGLLLKYRHFYGSYDYVAASTQWYRKEVRVIRNDKNIFSYKDAQGFRIQPNRKLRVKAVNAYMHHYGWVKKPELMQTKVRNFHKLWHDDEWIDKHVAASSDFDYGEVDLLERYEGTHPKAIQKRIAEQNWTFERDMSMNRLSLKDKIKLGIEKYTGWLPGEYKNYVEV